MTDRFLQHLEFEKRYSVHTVASYRTDLDQFTTYLRTEYDITEPSGIHYLMVRDFLSALMESGLSPRTVNRKKAALQSWFRYLVREGVIEDNPMKRVLSPRASKRLPVPVPCKAETGNTSPRASS